MYQRPKFADLEKDLVDVSTECRKAGFSWDGYMSSELHKIFKNELLGIIEEIKLKLRYHKDRHNEHVKLKVGLNRPRLKMISVWGIMNYKKGNLVLLFRLCTEDQPLER